MFRFAKNVLLFTLGLTLACTRPGKGNGGEPDPFPVILIVIDGLRVDYATPELMPQLTALGGTGVVFENHHAAFPTLTQPNAASLVTGSWPSAHGILGDTLYDPRFFSERLQIEWAGVLENLDRASGGRALTALTLGELLEGEGRDLLVVTSGSSGLVWILGYGAKPRPGRSRMMSPELFLPAQLETEAVRDFGPVPSSDSSAAERDAWAARLFNKAVTAEDRPALCILWLTGPDAAQRETGIGSPQTLEAVRGADNEIGTVVDNLREAGLLRKTNLLVTADHGFIRHTGSSSLPQELASAELKEALDSGKVVVNGGEIYLNDPEPGRVEAIVQALGLHAPIGALLTRSAQSGLPSGRVEGTLSYETINYDHERAGNVLVLPNWSDDRSDSGYPGLASGPGPAGSGGASPYELQIPLVAAGPAFRSGMRTSAPTAHVDLAPTVLQLLGIAVPDSMDGRILVEGLADGGEGVEHDPMLRTFRARMPLPEDMERITELRQQGLDGVSYLLWVRALYQQPPGISGPADGPADAESSGLQ